MTADDATTPLTATAERRIAAAPEAVFDAWLDPAMLARFMTPAPGTTVPRAMAEPRVGGRFEIVMKIGETEIPHSGRYLEIERPHRLIFTWDSPFSTEGSTVTVALSPEAEGTRITLTHIRFPSQESRDNHERGWARILTCLEEALP